MVVGFNHNIMYKGEMFHIQTEDSGVANPHIITLLYRGGTIMASKKTSYADIIKVENLDHVVEDLMKEQHKDMLRRLKAAEFDARIFAPQQQVAAQPAPPPTVSPSSTTAPQKPSVESASSTQSLDEIILEYLIAGEDK